MGPQLQWYKKYSEVKCTITCRPAHACGLINNAAKRILNFQVKHYVLYAPCSYIYLQDDFCLSSHLITAND